METNGNTEMKVTKHWYFHTFFETVSWAEQSRNFVCWVHFLDLGTNQNGCGYYPD